VAVRHVAGPTFEKDPNTVTKAACARGLALILGRMTLPAPTANGDRQLIIFTDTLTIRTHPCLKLRRRFQSRS
jgi:hypothetical protein